MISSFIVILGLDPRIQRLSKHSRWPLDCRVKPGNDNKNLAQRLDMQPEKLNWTAVPPARMGLTGARQQSCCGQIAIQSQAELEGNGIGHKTFF
jgi:hypothetical protein